VPKLKKEQLKQQFCGYSEQGNTIITVFLRWLSHKKEYFLPFAKAVKQAIAVYKHILKNQADNSVVIISFGFLNNLYDLLKDPEGYALLEKKVKLLIAMGGFNNDGFNFSRHGLVDQTQYVIENWPGTLVTTDVGGRMITVETLKSTTPVNNPVRRAYELEWKQGPGVGCSSWDQLSVLYAVYGTQYYDEKWEGGGEVWSDAKHALQLAYEQCQTSILEYGSSTGKKMYLFSNPGNPWDRVYMTIRTSFDDCNTWSNSKLVYEGPSAYSCLVKLPNAQVGLFFEVGEKRPYEKIMSLRF
jgi:hypothetical protein